MKTIRTIALLALSFAAVCGEAGEVLWNTFEGQDTFSYDFSDPFSAKPIPAYSVHSYGPFGTPEVVFAYTTTDGLNRPTSFTPSGDCNLGAPMAYWVLASAGEILNDLSDFQSHELVFECHCDGIHEDRVGGSHPLYPWTDTYYLALIGGENFDSYWGWVELEGDTENGLRVVSSAITKVGPLIVGGGLAYDSIPEPTSGFLLLLGSAMLALRRRL